MEYVLQTDGLEKRYGRTKVLNGLTMNVPKGAIYGFVGKNGAGKTTLIRIVCGLQPLTKGEYTLYGRDSRDKDIAKSRMRMGAVVEKPALYGGMTAVDNLKMQSIHLGIPGFCGIGDILKTVGLDTAGSKKVKNFSLGMKQRLGLALALLGDPDFIVLDEPINGLDPQGIIEVRELILRLNSEKGITFLISSHILDELSRTATHFGFINNGRIVKEISAKALESEYKKSRTVSVSNTAVLSRVLDGMGIEYTVCTENKARIYGDISVSRLVMSLAEQGAELFSCKEEDESLENYFLNLVGGKSGD